jgi:predicted ABC-class ATPase
MQSASVLKHTLKSIDHKGYPAYKQLRGIYGFSSFLLGIDHVQGDPFASPSKLHIAVSGKNSGFPADFYRTTHRRIAMQDYLLRGFQKQLEQYSFRAKGSGKSGMLSTSRCGQEILERTALSVDPTTGDIHVFFEAGFPAHGRTTDTKELEKMLFSFLPKSAEASLFYKNINQKELLSAIHLSDDQNYVREQLPLLNLCAFVADGAILPRESGISAKPMKHSVPFESPDSFRITLNLPHYGSLSGMGIPNGITLIVGGGYHGKSTLLKALELGVYNHIKGDGREYVITDASAVKLRAEDGRSIQNTDISMFIRNLPNGKDTVSFSTEDASGSTSQAANTIEALEAGTSLLLIDEDTSATNFMIRDELMQRVIHRDKEPITPFIERIRFLYKTCGVSSILVAGSSGSYFHTADHIIQMENYRPKDITVIAKEAAKDFPAIIIPENPLSFPDFKRCFGADRSLKSDRRLKMKFFGTDSISINKESIDLRYLEQLVDSEQSAALGYALVYASLHFMDGRKNLQQVVDLLFDKIKKDGLASILDCNYMKSGLAMPRRHEVFGCLNRYRKLS